MDTPLYIIATRHGNATIFQHSPASVNLTFKDEPRFPAIRAMVKTSHAQVFVINFLEGIILRRREGRYKMVIYSDRVIVMINIWGRHYNDRRSAELEKVLNAFS